MQCDNKINRAYQQTLLDRTPGKMWNMVAPKPLAVEKRPYKFSVVKEFLDLEKLVQKNKKSGRPDIRGDVDYLRPCLNAGIFKSNKKAFEDLVMKNGGPSQCRVLYITRHAQSEHNVISSQRGKKESFAVLGHYSDERDPSITNEGVSQAVMAGETISNSKVARFALPAETHTSSLWRCVQTAHLSSWVYAPKGKPIRIDISDDWREWKGMGILHVADGRSTKTKLSNRIDDFMEYTPKVLSSLGLGMPQVERVPSTYSDGTLDSAPELDSEHDDGFDVNLSGLSEEDTEFEVPETFINVDIRLERALARLFQESPDKDCFHIVTHGRTTQSLLRVLGFERDPNWEPIEKYRVWDFENCGTIAVLVRCEPRCRSEMDSRLADDQKLQQEEYEFINRKYQEDVEAGFLAIQETPVSACGRYKWADEIERLKKEAELSPHVAWRHEILKRACAGTFRKGDFQVRPWNWTPAADKN